MVLTDVAFSGLMAVGGAARGPENTRGKDGDDDEDDEERGSDVHA